MSKSPENLENFIGPLPETAPVVELKKPAETKPEADMEFLPGISEDVFESTAKGAAAENIPQAEVSEEKVIDKSGKSKTTQSKTPKIGPKSTEKSETKAEKRPESIEGLTKEQIEMIVGKVVEVLVKRGESIARTTSSTEKAGKKVSRDEAFYGRLDQIILDKVESVISGKNPESERLNRFLNDSDERFKKYQERLYEQRFDKSEDQQGAQFAETKRLDHERLLKQTSRIRSESDVELDAINKRDRTWRERLFGKN